MISSRDFTCSSCSIATVVVTGHSSRRSTPPRWTPTRDGLQRGQLCWPPLGRTAVRQRAATWPPLGRISWPPTRGRGRLVHEAGSQPGVRLTPAWAGKTSSPTQAPSNPSTHPRVGGEDVAAVPAPMSVIDSPPRGRGRRPVRPRRNAGDRLTPAWAGKTLSGAPSQGGASTHPRVGGEDGTRNTGARVVFDSPPRGRGRLQRLARKHVPDRLTPAWAGKTPASRPETRPRPTHPRVGGEDSRKRASSVISIDSPPRGRGRHSTSPSHRPSPRLTPAWAGKTQFPLSWVFRSIDSPPRGRGKPRPVNRWPTSTRLTPAWAGKTSQDCPSCWWSNDSPPRGRGRHPDRD